MDVTVDDREVLAALKKLEKAGQMVTRAIRRPVDGNVGKVLAVAVNKAPVAENTLRGAGRHTVDVIGGEVRAKITFGGLAAAYAQRQHEEESYAHTPEEYQRKYGKPLNRTKYQRTTFRGRVGKRGGLTITKRVWKYRRKRTLKGYRGGMAHFLHGSPKSAWNAQAEASLQRVVVDAAQKALESSLKP